MMPKPTGRAHDGRFSSRPRVVECTLGQARLMYQTYLAAVCRHQGMTPREVERQLARPRGEIWRGLNRGDQRLAGKQRGLLHVDPAWKAAAYARQLAMYLANTSDNVPQVLLAQVTGLSPAAVCVALQTIEDLRDHGDFDALVEIVAAEMTVTGQEIRDGV
jgi:hypothetical protein